MQLLQEIGQLVIVCHNRTSTKLSTATKKQHSQSTHFVEDTLKMIKEKLFLFTVINNCVQ